MLGKKSWLCGIISGLNRIMGSSMALSAILFVLAGIFFLSGFGAPVFGDCDTCAKGTSASVGATLIVFGIAFALLGKFGHKLGKAADWRLIVCLMFALMLVFVFFSPEIFSEDAYEHYMISKFSPAHPILFLDQWNKPIFTAITFLPAQFGLEAFRILSVLAGIATALLTVKIAQKLKFSNAAAVLLLLATMPFFWILSTSPMTEIFFALIFALFLYYLVQGKMLASALLVSFLPFVRQEGFLILGFFIAYCLVKKKPLFVPLSLIVPAIFSIIGFLAYGDILWIISSNPYGGKNFYGYGRLLHYPVELSLILGPAVYALLFFGGVELCRRKNLAKARLLPLLFLLFGIFHAAIWCLGVFHSAGYARVFISLAPAIALISAYALENLKKISGRLLVAFSAACVILAAMSPSIYHVVFLLISGAFSALVFLQRRFSFFAALDAKVFLIAGGILVAIIFLHFPQDFSIEHKTVIEAADWIKANGYLEYDFYADSPSAIFFLGKDLFDGNGARKSSLNAKSGSILIWDSHFSPRKLTDAEFSEKTRLLQTLTSQRVTIKIGLVEQDINKTG